MLDDVRALQAAWDRHSADMLETYLIQHVENPCINAQSVILRGLLFDALFPGQFTALILEEMRYSACALMSLRAILEEWHPQADPSARRSHPDSRARKIAFLRNCGRSGIDLARMHEQLVYAEAAGWRNFISPFEERWRTTVSGLSAHASVLELACGSANDARYYARYGLDQFISYTGVDLCRKNVTNAARQVPGGRFLCCDARALPFADWSHDYVFVCDLLEHLPDWGIDEILYEATRVARKEVWLSLFDADWIPVHEIRPEEVYYLNTLSLADLRVSLRRQGFASYVVDIPIEWAATFPGYRHYNEHARMIVAERME